MNLRHPLHRMLVPLCLAALLQACAAPGADAPWPERTVRIEQLRPTGLGRIAVPRQAPALQGPSGNTTLRVHVDAQGEVVRVALLEGSGNAALDAAAIRAVRTARFEPYRENGVAVPVTAIAPMQFLQRTHVSPPGFDSRGY